MKDIDFDELDRAVNSLMSGIPKSAPIKNDDIKTLTLESKLSDTTPSSTLSQAISTPSTSPALSDTKIDIEEPENESSSSLVALANRRGGRFMDVVHPSSDMKKPTSPSTPSRQGLTIEPRGGMPSAPQANDTTLVQVSSPQANEGIVAKTHSFEPQEDMAVSSNDWPDPLDIASDPSQESLPANETEVTASVLDGLIGSDAAAGEASQMPPLASPFLADAKVEKRPLGGTPQQESAEEPDHSPVLGVLAEGADDASSDMDSQLPPDPVDIEVPLPEELSTDVMAIESDDTQPASQRDDSAVSSSAIAAPVVAMEPKSLAGRNSIPQQYQEEANTGDQSSGAIFDTATYHQPLNHPAHKKTGWLWVIAIVGILLLGAAGGAALYFLGIV